ncbi:MAG: hypothetical protein MHPSP_003941, partial [Paramarteilia canceri]
TFLMHGEHETDENVSLFFSSHIPLIFLGVFKRITYQIFIALENSSNIQQQNVEELIMAIIAIFVSVKALKIYGIISVLLIEAFYMSFLSTI